ncbi:MAG: AMP-binding protein, partial [Chlamydiia bacterium]|nr:AMP-binding protein [Chlamydiia bacterium]
MQLMSKKALLDLFFETVHTHPSRIAIRWREGVLSYAQLAKFVEQIASAIAACTEEGPIAIQQSRSPLLVASLLGAWMAGRPFVALDPRHPAFRRQHIIEEAMPAMVLTDADFQRITTGDGGLTELVPHETDIAYILYTSGSTGTPKGISLTDRGVAALVAWAHARYTSDELACVLASTTITFDLSIFEIFVPLTCAQSLYLV